MINEYIKNIYVPETSDDWFLIETDKATYSLHLGGIERENDIDTFLYDQLELPILNKRIKSIYTDNFTVYFISEDGGGLKHGPNSISGDGEISFSLDYIEKGNSLFELIAELENNDDEVFNLVEI